MIKNIEIESFRGINFLEVQDLKRINLIGGINNSGKTTFLESINMFIGQDFLILDSVPILLNQ